MIISGLVQWFINIIRTLFSDISFDFEFPYASLAVFYEYLDVATYFFPLGAIRSIIMFILILQSFRIGVSLIKTVWELLPLL